MTRVEMCRMEDIALGTIRQDFLPDGTLIALYNVGGRIYATADTCTHAVSVSRC